VYNVYDESDIKIFGCSSLSAVIKYITEVGVDTVVTNLETRVNLANEEYILIKFGCPTSAHYWIIKHVPGELVSILSCDSGTEYKYK
jgi:hypothetical protein